MLRKRGRKRTGNQPETNSKLAVNFMNKLFLIRDIIGLNLLPSPPFPPLRFRFVSKNPLHLYPHLAPKLHAKMQPFALPSHGLKAEYSSSLKPRKTAHPIARTTLKWQIQLRQCRYPLSGGSSAARCWGDETEKSSTFQSAPQRGPGVAPLARLWFLSS